MELQLLRIREATGDTILNHPQAIYETMRAEAHADRECLWVLHLNTRLMIIDKELVHMGTLDASLVHPREVFRKAIINSAASIATVHNHPSGSLEPSSEDKVIWKQLKGAGELLGIKVVDNLIISCQGYYSDSERKVE